MSNIASAIKATEAALEKGDYGICIKIIDPLLLDFQAETEIGGQLRLLIVTAYMGKGDEQKAINICQTLIHNKEESVRQQAKQLLSILDAPRLPKPSNWSVEIPNLEMEPSLKSSVSKAKKKREKIYHPPTGPTKSLDFGFSIITLIIILLITFLLSGCVDISTNLSVTGPDRLKISLDIDSNSGESIPWQMEFEENLSKKHSILKLQTHEDKQHFESPTIRFEEANKLLIKNLDLFFRSAYRVTPKIDYGLLDLSLKSLFTTHNYATKIHNIDIDSLVNHFQNGLKQSISWYSNIDFNLKLSSQWRKAVDIETIFLFGENDAAVKLNKKMINRLKSSGTNVAVKEIKSDLVKSN